MNTFLTPVKPKALAIIGIIFLAGMIAKAQAASDAEVEHAQREVMSGAGSISFGEGPNGKYDLSLTKQINEKFFGDVSYYNFGQVEKRGKSHAADEYVGMAGFDVWASHNKRVRVQLKGGLGEQNDSTGGVDTHQLAAVVSAAVKVEIARGWGLEGEAVKSKAFGNDVNDQKPYGGSMLALNVVKNFNAYGHAVSHAGSADIDPVDARIPAQYSIFVGHSHANACCDQTAESFQLKRLAMLDDRSATGATYSVSGLKLGRTKNNDQTGVTGQMGYVVRSGGGFQAGVEGGLFANHDGVQHKNDVAGIITLTVGECTTKIPHLYDACIMAKWDRINAPENRIGPKSADADNYQFGVGVRYGRTQEDAPAQITRVD